MPECVVTVSTEVLLANFNLHLGLSILRDGNLYFGSRMEVFWSWVCTRASRWSLSLFSLSGSLLVEIGTERSIERRYPNKNNCEVFLCFDVYLASEDLQLAMKR